MRHLEDERRQARIDLPLYFLSLVLFLVGDQNLQKTVSRLQYHQQCILFCLRDLEQLQKDRYKVIVVAVKDTTVFLVSLQTRQIAHQKVKYIESLFIEQFLKLLH